MNVSSLELGGRPAGRSRHAGAAVLDDEVLQLVRNGDVTTALRQIMRLHGSDVYRFCCAALRDRTLAEDVHQQVFIATFRDLPTFRGRSSVRSWLFAIARHRVVDAVRARGRALARFDDDEPGDVPDPLPLPDEAIDDRRLREALALSLAELDEHARIAVLLRYQQGFTFEEMARICGEKAGTLGARVARARPRLRARIEQLIGELR